MFADSTENQFIMDFSFYPNPRYTLIKPSFLSSFNEKYDHFAFTVIADPGYCSEENHRFIEENGMEDYVTNNRFHIEHRMHYAPGPFSTEAMHYNADEDYDVCPMGQKMERMETI